MTAIRNSDPTRSWAARNRLEVFLLSLGSALLTTAVITGLLAH